MKPMILVAMFLTVVIIWVVMKLSLWIFAVNDEKNYVKKQNPENPMDPTWPNPYEDVDEEDEEYGDLTDYR